MEIFGNYKSNNFLIGNCFFCSSKLHSCSGGEILRSHSEENTDHSQDQYKLA